MRVLLCCEFYWPSVGGVQKVVQEVAEGLTRRGHAVTVATTLLSEREHNQHNGVTIRPFAVSGNGAVGLRGNVDAYREFVTTGEYDVLLVYAAQQWTFDALWSVLDRIPFRKVHVPCGYSGLFYPQFQEYFTRLPDILKQFDALVYHAKNYRDVTFAREHGLKQLAFIPNGASAAEFGSAGEGSFRNSRSIPEKSRVLVSIGSPPFAKGFLELISAFAVLDIQQDCVLVFNGHFPSWLAGRSLMGSPMGSLLGALRQLLGGILRKVRGSEPSIGDLTLRALRQIRRNPRKRIMLVNEPRERVIQMLFEADLFVFASHIEYSPLVLFEAAAAGLPFVTVDVGNAIEIAEWTGAGVVCPSEKDSAGRTTVAPADLATSMAELIHNDTLRATMGARGREAWQARFTFEHLVERYEAVLSGGHVERF